MLELIIPATEFYNDDTGDLFEFGGNTITLEHSLLSLAEWEAIYKKPWLSQKTFTRKEFIDYIKCMTIGDRPPDASYQCLGQAEFDIVEKYLQDSHTATWFGEDKDEKAKPQRQKAVTAELIYYSMLSMQIPKEFEQWNLNRLMTLLRVFSIKNSPAKKLSSAENGRRQAAMNRARKGHR